jgi:ATP synthase protein I
MEKTTSLETDLDLDSLNEAHQAPLNDYVLLQRRIYLVNVVLALFAVFLTALVFDSSRAISLFIGAFSGIVYLRLLARSVGRLGETSKAVGKTQLLVPVLLVLMVSKLPQLELLPALAGFLLYKLSIVFQVLLESRTKAFS